MRRSGSNGLHLNALIERIVSSERRHRLGVSGGEDLLIWGDTVHIPELQVPRPDITMLYDTDQPLAAASRVAMFDLAVRDNLLIGGMHLHFPGFARMTRENGIYRILTEPWAYTL